MESRQRAPAAKTYGLTHIALAVRDPERALRFYGAVVGAVAVSRHDDFIQAQTPGSRDVLVFHKAPRRAGKPGGLVHFGFRLLDPAGVTVALAAAKAVEAKILRHGEFCPGEPYLVVADPDGYEVEIWYELPTLVDPPARRSRTRRVRADRVRQRNS